MPKTESLTGRPNSNLKLIDQNKLERLRSLIGKNVYSSGISLSDNVKKLARTDKDFNDFLKQFRTKDEPSMPNYLDAPESLDMHKYMKDAKRTEADRLDELYLLDKFRKKKLAETLASEERKNRLSHEFMDEQLESDGGDFNEESLMTKSDIKNIEFGNRVYFNEENFQTMFIGAGSSTNITKLARVNKRWVLLYMGDTSGIISYGRGTGLNYQDAYERAVMELKRNMICINIDRLMTVPGYLTGRYSNTVVEIFRYPRLFRGYTHYYNILALAGLKDFGMRLRCRNVNEHAIMYAFFNCLIQNETPRSISEKTGMKFYEISYGRAWGEDVKTTNQSIL